MAVDKEMLTLDKLIERIALYKSGKPNSSAESLGMFFNTSEYQYFYDTGTGKVFRLDDNMHEFLQKLLYENSSVEELEKAVCQWNINTQEFLDYIVKEDLLKGTAGNALYNDAFLKKAREDIKTKSRHLILELTGACNLRCKYCIYSAQETSFRGFNSESITEEIIRASIDYMNEHAAEEVFITFYGGEPLIRFDLMKYAIEYARAKITNREVHFGFTTNMTLMTKEIAEYLVQVPNMSMICSLDGPEDVQNASRVYANGEGTFQDVIKGLNYLREVIANTENDTFNLNFNAVYMVPYNKEKLYRIDEMFKDLCNITKNSSYSISYPTFGTVPTELEALYPPEKGNTMWEWMSDMVKKCDSIADLKLSSIMESLAVIHQRQLSIQAMTNIPMNSCCIPGARRLYIDTKGNMYVCERIDKSPKIGNILNGLDMDTIFEKYFYEYSDKSIEHCKNCWAAKMCPLCYADRMTEEGIASNAHAYCNQVKEHLKRKFILYHEILEVEPQKLDILNSLITV